MNLKKQFPFLYQQMGSQKGLALLMAMSAVLIIFYLVVEVTYDSSVEYVVNSQALNRIKAHYAAKAGAELSLLRIKTFQQAQAQLGQNLGTSASLLDQIWQFPLAWPLPIPEDLNAVDKDSFQKITQESLMDANYIITIEDEGSKLDLNDLVSQSKVLKESARSRLLNIFESKKTTDEAFARRYQTFRFEELINAMTDWMSDKANSLNGGSKTAGYQDLNIDGTSFPPNRGFRTLGELRLVPLMNDEFFSLLESQVTLYGMRGINPNLANKEVIMGIDPAITEEIANEVLKHREDLASGGPFKDASEFWSFLSNKGARLTVKTDDVPLVFNTVMNFKIKSTGEYSGATREITLLTLDLIQTSARIRETLEKEKKQNENPDAENSKSDPGKDPKNNGQPAKNITKTLAPPKGPPRIVQWSER